MVKTIMRMVTGMTTTPTLRMLTTPPADLRRRTEAFAGWVREIPGVSLGVWEDEAFVGGGSLPDVSVPTTVLGLSAAGVSESDLAARLRAGAPAVMTRVQDGRVLIDLRCVPESQEAELLGALTAACTGTPCYPEKGAN